MRDQSASLVLITVLTVGSVCGCGRPALHCGQTVTTSNQDTFLVALLERGQGVFAGRLKGVEMRFYADGHKVGRAQTDELGYAVAVGRSPVGALQVEARTTAGSHLLSSQQDVIIWESNRTIIVCDIDGTASDTDTDTLVFGRQDTGSRPFPGAAQTLQALSKRHSLVFMTGRPRFLIEKTREWLRDHEFPLAPIITAPSMHDAESVEGYKERTIALMKRIYLNALIGIGNAETDSQAYTVQGMLAVMIDDGKNRRFRAEAVPLRTWSRVRQFFDANQELLGDPKKLRALTSVGGLLLYPQESIAAGAKP